MNPALTSDIQARFYRAPDRPEVDISQQLLDDAWDLLVSRRPSLEADMTAARTVKTGNVVRVLVAMVGRVLSNPRGSSRRRSTTTGTAATRSSPAACST
jgi:hypothetical protein